jgi:hypothetical protein
MAQLTALRAQLAAGDGAGLERSTATPSTRATNG